MLRSTRPTRLAAAAAMVVLAATGLTGCATGPGGCTESGPSSAEVSASGAFGTAPDVEFPAPLNVDTTEVSTLIRGGGAQIGPGQQILTDVTILNASTGEVVTASEYTGDATAGSFVVGATAVSGLQKAFRCAQVGERLAAVIPPEEGIPAASRPDTIGADDTIIVVADVRRAYLARADGRDQIMAGGLPAVVLGPDGRPGITLPEGDPAGQLRVADLKTGAGAVIRRGDTAIVQYTGVLWKPGDPADGTVFDSSWTEGAPRALPVERGQIIPGLVRALAGARVGSQVLAVVPPRDGYGAEATSSVPAGSTLVFVVDVLGKV